MVETEVKIRWAGSAEEARALIEGAGFRMQEARTFESDTLFDRAGELRESDKLLRLRRTRSETHSTATVTYKGPATREVYKSREEIEFTVSDGDRFAMVLERLGYQAGFRYEKYRTKFSASGADGIITLDETPIGVFLELEGPEYWIDEAAAKLGFARGQFLTASYASLYYQYRRSNPEAPSDMTFE
jgi:adenylate cyclase class 2